MSVALDNLVHADPTEVDDIERLQERIEEIYKREGKALLIVQNRMSQLLKYPPQRLTL